MADNEEYTQELIDSLLTSHWPACDTIANSLAEIGTPNAVVGLLKGLRCRRHHVRSASLKALARFKDDAVIKAIEALRNDPAFEVRQDAAEALKKMNESLS
jgi:HEAT repeat protein